MCEDRYRSKGLYDSDRANWDDMEQYHHERFWNSLSASKHMPWSMDLLARFQDRWDWRGHWDGVTTIYGLSANPALPWSKELLARFEDHWDWRYLSDSMGANIPWLLEVLERYRDRWDWGILVARKDILDLVPKLNRQEIEEVMLHHFPDRERLPSG